MNSQPISVILEYKRLGLDFEALLTDIDALDKLLSKAEEDKNEIEDTLKATQFCYNQTPNVENRKILEDTTKENLKVKYRLIMLTILKLLSQDCDSYEQCREKREKLLKLIEDRKTCLKSLGIRLLVDPFNRTKVQEQLDTILSMSDNSKNVNNIRKEIADLTSRIETMTSQNNEYLISLSNTRNLIESSVGFGDIDVTSIELNIDTPSLKEITENQVINIRDIPSKLNMNITKQKTDTVIRRVNQMINGRSQKSEEIKDTIVPELIIIPNSVPTPTQSITMEDESSEFIIPELRSPDLKVPEEKLTPDELSSPIFFKTEDTPKLDDTPSVSVEDSFESEVAVPEVSSDYLIDSEEDDDIDLAPEVIENQSVPVNINNDKTTSNANLFETVVPFSEPSMFNDRTDDNTPSMKMPEIIDFPLAEVQNDTEQFTTPKSEGMPEIFWPTQETIGEVEENNDVPTLSFDEQIDMLRSTESNNSKIRKKVA